ncbi:MAG: PAS domain-containing protein [Synechococcales cyanobacterium K44_A2020_017]|nr:PAS domain-containing protein [Synechococcales cyanobacterium K32_A2020_035]MBF2095669.1 PAS domain-containing protein [Synechococcales cyanobacterium K44_A2020_017]
MVDSLLHTVVTVAPDTPLLEVLRLMSCVQSAPQFLPDSAPHSDLPWRSPDPRPNCALVTDAERLVGIITSKNIIQALAPDPAFAVVCAQDVMTTPVISLPELDLRNPEAIARYFQRYAIHHLPVVNAQGHPLGLLTSEQFLQYQLNTQLQDEITRHHQTEEALQQRIRLEELVTTISAQFIPLEAAQIDDGIRRALQAIAEFTGADRGYLFRVSENQSQISNTHEWCAPTSLSLQANYQHLQIQDYVDRLDQLRRLRGFAIASLPPTPPSDRLLHRQPQMKAAIQVPIVLEQSLLGFVGLDAERSPRPWGQETIMLLILVGEIIASALKRQQTEIILKQSMATNRALLGALPDAILRITGDGILVNKKPDAHGVIPVPDDEFLGKHLTDVFPPEIAETTLTYVQRALETKAIQSFEYQLKLGNTLYDYEARFAVSDRHEVMVIIRDISDRKRTQAELQRAKDQLRVVLDAVPGLISWIRDDLVYQGVNTRMAAVFGRSPEDFSGQPIGFLGGRLDFNTFVEEFFASSNHTATRETCLDINGTNYEYLVVAQKYAQDHAAVFVGIDITERKRVESQLYESQQLLQLVVDNIPEAIFWKDRNSVYLGCNLAFAHVVGLESPADLGEGKTDFDLFSWAADAAEYYRQDDRRVMESDCPQYHVMEAQIQADGQQYWIDKNLIPLHDSDRQVVGILGTCEDITARRTAEQKLRQSEEQYRTLAKNFPNGAVLLFDPHLRYTIADGTGLELMNLSKASIEGKTLWDVFPTAIAEQLEPHYRRALAGESSSLEISLRDRIYLVQVTPLKDSQGDCFAGMVTTQDITKYKRVEQEIRNALEKEKQLNELKSRFISMASHEFRTPLATILGSSEILRHFGNKCSEEKRLKHYERIQTGVEQMTRLLDDVLLIGRAEAGRVPFQPTPIDLVPFCENLSEELQISTGYKRNVVIQTQFLPDAIASLVIEADEQLLRQVLTNLLSNAIKYSHPGGVVDFSIMLDVRSVVFSIADQGIGIPDADQARLFEQFHRAGNVGTTQGTGLGLSIVKKSVELHGGTITLVSHVNQGTTCTVTLPLTQPSPVDRS